MAQTSLNSTGVASSGALSLQSNGTTEAIGISTGQVATLAQNPILTSGTVNGLAFLNASKVLTTGSALTFDGSKLVVAGGAEALRLAQSAPYLSFYNAAQSTRYAYIQHTGTDLAFVNEQNGAIPFYTNGSEQMRLTSTGLGIGTSSPASKLDVVGAGVFKVDGSGSTTPLILRNNNTASTQVVKLAFDSNGAIKASINAAVYNNDYMTFNVGSDIERMRLDSAGNLGLGVTPSAWATYKSFDLNQYGYISSGGAGWMELMDNTYYNAGYKYKANGYASHYLQQNSTHIWYTAPSGTAGSAITFTQAMTLDASGNLLVGATSANGVGWTLNPNGSGQIRSSGTGAQDKIQFANSNGVVGAITTTGSVTAYNITSDQRLKKNIQDAAPASSLIDSLQVREYDWKSDGTHQRYGFIAQELLTVVPEAVYQPEDTEQMMAVDYSKLVPMMVKEIQSLRKRLAAAGI